MPRRTLILLLAGTAAAAACRQEQPDPEAGNNASEPVLNRPIVPRPDPPLGRASLLAAVAEAASATAAGVDMPDSVRSLDGRQFELRIRFGCRGPSTELSERWLGWSFDPEQRRIRVRAMPTISKNEALVAKLGGDAFEAVEGFWIPRPWLLQPVCPANPAVQRLDGQPQTGEPGKAEQSAQSGSAQQQQRQRRQPGAETAVAAASEEERAEPVPTSPRVGIAQFFTDEDSRTRRRDMRPYQAAHTLAEGKAISSQGYNLVLSGRLRALPGRGVVQCSARNPDSPPECVVSAEFLRVWIEQPDTREIIAEWGGG